MHFTSRKVLTFLFLLLVVLAAGSAAQTSVFKYQGSLSDGGSPANGSFQMQFRLFDAPVGGSQIGATLADVPVTAAAGNFATSLDFGTNAFSGGGRWLEISVRRSSGEGYVTLSPREQVASSPYAVRTISAQQADSALDSQKLGGVNASQYIQTGDTRLFDDRNPTPGSPNYIHNSSVQQPASNFNISGNGTVGSLNSNGPITVGGTVAPSVAPAGQGRVYFDSVAGKFKVSESGSAFVNLVGAAGGLAGSGTANRIPLWSNSTTLADSNIYSSNGNIGIGTATPANTLDVFGFFRALSPAGGNVVSETTGGANAWAKHWMITPVQRWSIGSSNGFNGNQLYFSNENTQGGGIRMAIMPTGSVGIGTTAPENTLDVNGFIRAYNTAGGNVVSETKGGVNSWAKHWMITPVQRWSIGSSNGFNGNQLYFANETTGNIRMAIMPGGNVGIGTDNPLSALEVRGTSVQTRVTDNTSGNTLVMQGGSGSNMKVTGYNYGTGQPVPLYLSTDGANTVVNSGGGSVLQPGGGYGVPKAMLYVNGDGAIIRCYNGITGSTTGGCGFTSFHGDSGHYTLGGLPNMNSRFVSATLESSANQPTAMSISGPSGTTLGVYIFTTNSFNGVNFPGTDRPFMIIIY
jgi:hypothetical protein